jgi:hypothetical protein
MPALSTAWRDHSAFPWHRWSGCRRHPATGKQYNLPGVSIVQVEGDKIRTERVYFDLLGLQYQLGLMEQKAPVAETK